MQPRLSCRSLLLPNLVVVVFGAEIIRQPQSQAILTKGRLYPKVSGDDATTSGIPDPELEQEIGQGSGGAPVKGDYNPETTIMWDERNKFPLSVEALIAVTWITLVASLPLVVVFLEGRDITKTQLAEFAVMWAVFFSGVYLFTNVLYFQSVHFETIRRLTIVESVYLLAQILTTVGYGDITPAKPRGQVFVAFYVLFSLLVLANVFSEVTELITQRTKEAVAQFTAKIKEAQRSLDMEAEEDGTNTRRFFDSSPPPLDFRGLISSSLFYLFFVVMGCFFFKYYPGEGKTWFQGVYMSVITLSTVGFGAFTPVTEGGKVFGAYWMLFGCAALAAVIGNFTDVFIQIKMREKWDPALAKVEKQTFFSSLPAECDELYFLKQSLLHKKLLKEEDAGEILKFFRKLTPKGGIITRDTLDRHLEAMP